MKLIEILWGDYSPRERVLGATAALAVFALCVLAEILFA